MKWKNYFWFLVVKYPYKISWHRSILYSFPFDISYQISVRNRVVWSKSEVYRHNIFLTLHSTNSGLDRIYPKICFYILRYTLRKLRASSWNVLGCLLRLLVKKLKKKYITKIIRMQKIINKILCISIFFFLL